MHLNETHKRALLAKEMAARDRRGAEITSGGSQPQRTVTLRDWSVRELPGWHEADTFHPINLPPRVTGRERAPSPTGSDSSFASYTSATSNCSLNRGSSSFHSSPPRAPAPMPMSAPSSFSSLMKFWGDAAKDAAHTVADGLNDVADSVAEAGEIVSTGIEELFTGKLGRMQRAALKLVLDRAARRMRNREVGRALNKWVQVWATQGHAMQVLLRCRRGIVLGTMSTAFTYWASGKWAIVILQKESGRSGRSSGWLKSRSERWQRQHVFRRAWTMWIAWAKAGSNKGQIGRGGVSPGRGGQLKAHTTRSRLILQRVIFYRLAHTWATWKNNWRLNALVLSHLQHQWRGYRLYDAMVAWVKFWTPHDKADRHLQQEGRGHRLAHVFTCWRAFRKTRRQALKRYKLGSKKKRIALLRRGWMTWHEECKREMTPPHSSASSSSSWLLPSYSASKLRTVWPPPHSARQIQQGQRPPGWAPPSSTVTLGSPSSSSMLPSLDSSTMSSVYASPLASPKMGSSAYPSMEPVAPISLDAPEANVNVLRSDIMKWLQRAELVHDLDDDQHHYNSSPGSSPEHPEREQQFFDAHERLDGNGGTPSSSSIRRLNSDGRRLSFERAVTGVSRAASFGRSVGKSASKAVAGSVSTGIDYLRYLRTPERAGKNAPSNREALERAKSSSMRV